MTTEQRALTNVPEPIPGWLWTYVAADFDAPLTAQYLGVDEIHVRRWVAMNQDDINAAAEKAARFEFWNGLRNDVNSYDEHTMVKMLAIFSGQPMVVNPTQNNFNFGNDAGPRERLEAELDRVASRAHSNGSQP